MGMCKGCGTVFSALIMKNGYCQNCKPEWFEEVEEGYEEKIEDKTISNEIEKKDSQTCGIVSFVLSIVSLFTGVLGVLFATISLICGIINSKNAFGIIGIIISGLYLIGIGLTIFGLVSFINLN